VAGSPAVQEGLQQLRLPGSLDPDSRLWIWNVGDRAAKLSLGSGRVVRVPAGAVVEGPGGRSRSAAVRAGSELVLVAASRDFDSSAFELDVRGTMRQTEAEPGVVRLTRPAWAQDLLVQSAGRSPLLPGRPARAAMEVGEDGRARVAVGLLDAGSEVAVAIRDARGAEIRSFAVVASLPVRLRADLGPAAQLAGAGAELTVVRGRAVAARGGLQLKTTNGTASMSSNLVFSGNYTFSVSGGPANTCGELDIYRNGSWEFTPGWFCTNGAGNGTMGPWNWSDKASDETGEPIFIRWPDNTATSSTYVIIDKNPAYTYIDSSMPTNSTPTSYYGHATDATWGTGFDFGYGAVSYFQDLTSGNYWNPSTGQYNSGSPVGVLPSAVYSSGRWYVTWYTSFPAVNAHTTGHQYRWYTCFTDAQNGYCTGAGPGYWYPYDFTAN
jgi:hypothetical protein